MGGEKEALGRMNACIIIGDTVKVHVYSFEIQSSHGDLKQCEIELIEPGHDFKA